MVWLHRLWDLRGYLIIGAVPVGVFMRGSVTAALDVGLIVLILALSKDGPLLFGQLSRQLRSIGWMKSPLAAAVLMVMPVKTFSAMLGAENETALRSVAEHATIGLIVLTLGLGLLPSLFSCFRDVAPEEPRGEKIWIVALDVSVLLFLLAMGRDGVAIFGEGADRLQRSLPLFHESWMRGLLATIPVKTVSTLVLAGSWKRRIEIAVNGMPLMATWAVLTFSVSKASNLGIGWAYLLGALAAFMMLKATSNFRVYAKGV